MDVEATKFTLFQVPLTPADVAFFRSPENQPTYNPMNCGAVAGQLMGLVSKPLSEKMTAEQMGIYIQEWVAYLNNGAYPPTYIAKESTLREIYNSLFEGFATLVLFRRMGAVGHYAVFVSGTDGNVYLLDPQSKNVFKNEDIRTYLTKESLHEELPIVIHHTKAKTKSEHLTAFVEGPLTKRMETCQVMGGKRKQRTGKKRKTRSLRRRIRRTRKQ